MTRLEAIVYTLSVAVEKDEIGKAELIRVLRELVGFVADREPEGDTSDALTAFQKDFDQRFGHIMHGESGLI
jgi:hypothetical protein